MDSFLKFKIENCKLKIPAKRAGFTLTELIVVMAVASILMTAFVVQQSSWNDQLALNTQAYELALMIRQAQIYSLGVREYTGIGVGDQFNVIYGVYFNTGDDGRYYFFVDKNSNYILDSGEMIEEKVLTKNIKIDRLCGIESGAEKCSPQAGIRKVSVTFKRPETKAIVKFINPGDNTQDSVFPPTKIVLKSTKSNKEKLIKIEAKGQISVVQN